MKSIAVLGYSNTGKTTFIEVLSDAADTAGLSTAIIKYSRHSGNFDRPGSDTERFLRSPAQIVGYRNDERWVISVHAPVADPHARPGSATTPAETLPRWMKPLMTSADLLILEGRRLTDSYVVLCAGDAATPDELKYPPSEADLVIVTDHRLAASLGGELSPTGPTIARSTGDAVEIIISTFTEGGIA